MEKIVESFELYGKQYRLETGELAKQATGSVVVTQGDTTVLVTAVIGQEKDYDFFPLTVDFIEKMYAVGRIPGGYLKREARPSDKGTLTARMVDRPIRPGFVDGFKREVHVVCTTLVVDSVNPPGTICVMGASAALMLGAAPFDGPAACVRIGRDIETGEFIVNPTFEESEHSDLELTIAGTADYISMVEAGAAEISEEDMLAAMTFGQEAIAAFCEKQAAFLAKVNPTPMDYTIHAADPSVAERVDAHLDEMSAALKDADKAARMQKVEAVSYTHLDAFVEEVQFLLPEGPAWFPADMETDQPLEVMVAEFIREKILRNFFDEVPHAIGVAVEEMEFEKPNLYRIFAVIYVERDSQKGIIIGKRGAAIKRIGIEAREDLEQLLGCRVFLDLSVKVRKNWRRDANQIRRFGYGEGA